MSPSTYILGGYQTKSHTLSYLVKELEVRMDLKAKNHEPDGYVGQSQTDHLLF